jgi:CHAT domain-containing protein
MLYSGLLLAGANLGGRGTAETVAEDGIVTAHEVTSLNLHGTQNVILSACETGLGELSVGQGAFGMARAFQMAGARQVVAALWPVSDAASIEVMEKIYSSPDKSIAEALQEFAKERINADRAAGRTPDPYYWAPYVSYGDWRAR